MSKNISTHNPIGIFDSGIGGLTVAQAVSSTLPNENIVYFGDTCHTPWGDKSKHTIDGYVAKICDFLLAKNCKCIIVACNTASAISGEHIKLHLKNKVSSFNVIDPTAKYAIENLSKQTVGLIGTKQTISSASYENKLSANLQLKSLATPMLVPLIEEGFVDKLACKLILDEYLNHERLQNIQALILGCTHYPILRQKINQYYQDKKLSVKIIDSAQLIANDVSNFLSKNNLLNTNSSKHQQDFYVSDKTEHFLKVATMFFPKYCLEQYELWG